MTGEKKKKQDNLFGLYSRPPLKLVKLPNHVTIIAVSAVIFLSVGFPRNDDELDVFIRVY